MIADILRLESLFLHFFDIHFLEEKRASLENAGVFQECRLATRLAILSAEQVYLPAASYIESPVCRRIIQELEFLLPLGLVQLVGGASNLAEFNEERVEIYKEDSYQSRVYSEYRISDLSPPFARKLGNTTSFVKDNWLLQLQNYSLFKRLSAGADGLLPHNLDKLWAQVPEKLQGLAFILDHVGPHLGSFFNNRMIRPRLLSVINAGYFESYTRELQAGIVTDLYYLEAGHQIPSFGKNLPYSPLIRALRNSPLLARISQATAEELLNIRYSEEWLSIFGSICLNESSSEKRSIIHYHDMKTRSKMVKNKFFIVHGHDEVALLQLKDYLQNTLKFPEPIVLKQQPNRGRTIIEKFEDCSDDVDGAIVLLTPDDLGAAAGVADERTRARQNVIFELGFFAGKFGRRSGRVLLLKKGDLEIPSDLSGVIYIDISAGIEAAGEEIRRELGA